VIGAALWEIEQLCSDEKLETFWASEVLGVAEAKAVTSDGNSKPLTARMVREGGQDQYGPTTRSWILLDASRRRLHETRCACTSKACASAGRREKCGGTASNVWRQASGAFAGQPFAGFLQKKNLTLRSDRNFIAGRTPDSEKEVDFRRCSSCHAAGNDGDDGARRCNRTCS